MRVLKIVADAAVAFYEELLFHLLGGLAHLLCWVLVIPGPFALAGIYAIGQRSVRGKGVSWRLIWGTIKEFGVRSLLLFLIILFGFGVVAINLYFYNVLALPPVLASLAPWMTPLFIVLGVLWMGVAFYAQAFLMELEEPTIALVLRNSFFLTVLKPAVTLGILLVSVLATVLSIALPLLIIVLPGFLSTLALTAVRTLIADITEQAATLEENEQIEAFDSPDEPGEVESAEETVRTDTPSEQE